MDTSTDSNNISNGVNNIVQVHLWISGQVQGVFFRAHTKQKALALGLAGWVKNLPSGRVEAVFQGDKTKVEKMINWCHHGPLSAEVTNVDIKWEELKDIEPFQSKGFYIKY
jgi:acylphosphatase